MQKSLSECGRSLGFTPLNSLILRRHPFNSALTSFFYRQTPILHESTSQHVFYIQIAKSLIFNYIGHETKTNDRILEKLSLEKLAKMTVLKPLIWVHICALTLIVNFTNAQEFLGQLQQPLPTDSIAPIGWHGENEDMSGGYAIGDTVADFQIFDLEGNAVRLATLLAGDKPVVLSSASATCVRFSNAFNLEITIEASVLRREFMYAHREDIEWLFIYGIEAHPADLENCTSNCPAVTIPAANGETIFQHVQYSDRQNAITLWESIDTSDTLNFDFGFPIAADNPDNTIYDRFFSRPFGCLVIDCGGIVIERGDWTNIWLEEVGMEFLDELLASPQYCEYSPFCFESSLDSDGDGICDGVELYQESDVNDPCDPDNTDTDGDGVCDHQEIIDGTDPFSNGTGTGVKENLGDIVHVFPNPVQDVLTINLDSYPATAVLRDLQGKFLMQESLEQDGQLNLESIDQGTYLLEILTEKSGSNVRRIVKN
ncbi:MAG: hypothetical protein ACI9RU_001415 [Litorivivens sp.]|jgi:hypothetical protein